VRLGISERQLSEKRRGISETIRIIQGMAATSSRGVFIACAHASCRARRLAINSCAAASYGDALQLAKAISVDAVRLGSTGSMRAPLLLAAIVGRRAARRRRRERKSRRRHRYGVKYSHIVEGDGRKIGRRLIGREGKNQASGLGNAAWHYIRRLCARMRRQRI
jgi:hypothetical protein